MEELKRGNFQKKNIGENVHDLGFDKEFLDTIRTRKEVINLTSPRLTASVLEKGGLPW